jgi:hypothetical protein
VTKRTTQIARKTHLSKTTFACFVIASPLCGKHGIAHGVRPEFLVLLDFFRRLFHVTALPDGLRLILSVDLLLKFREAHGVIPHAAMPKCLDSSFDFFCLFHVGPSL